LYTAIRLGTANAAVVPEIRAVFHPHFELTAHSLPTAAEKREDMDAFNFVREFIAASRLILQNTSA
jgi:hypothetical protein